MAKKLNHILIIDLEATCWDGATPAGMENEIIEIGLCVLDLKSLERTEKRAIMVKPERSEISAFCTELTTIKPEDVENGVSFRQACKILRTEYKAQEIVWGSFGDYDRRQVEKQCLSFGVGYPFGVTHLNVKNLAAISMGWEKELGMDAALQELGLPLEGTHHRGIDDAWNIANILANLLKKMRG